MIIDPRFMKDAIEWTDRMIPSLDQDIQMGRLFSNDDWKSWATGLLAFNKFARLEIPSPYQFDDWRDWAARFNELYDQGS